MLYGGAEIKDSRERELLPAADGTHGKEGDAPWRGRDEQPSWTREQPVLLAEVVAPPLLSRGAAISGSGCAQIDRLAVKMSNRCSSGLIVVVVVVALVVVEVVVVVVVVGVVVVVVVVVVEGVFVFLVHH